MPVLGAAEIPTFGLLGHLGDVVYAGMVQQATVRGRCSRVEHRGGCDAEVVLCLRGWQEGGVGRVAGKEGGAKTVHSNWRVCEAGGLRSGDRVR